MKEWGQLLDRYTEAKFAGDANKESLIYRLSIEIDLFMMRISISNWMILILIFNYTSLFFSRKEQEEKSIGSR